VLFWHEQISFLVLVKGTDEFVDVGVVGRLLEVRLKVGVRLGQRQLLLLFELALLVLEGWGFQLSVPNPCRRFWLFLTIVSVESGLDGPGADSFFLLEQRYIKYSTARLNLSKATYTFDNFGISAHFRHAGVLRVLVRAGHVADKGA
jgi:hypothetical protein